MLRTSSVIALLVVGRVAGADPDGRPAFFDAGVLSRHFSAPNGIAARSLAPVAPADTESSAIAADLRFGMAMLTYGYLGVETEFGQLESRDSNLGGLYAIAGTRARLGGLMLGLELAGGWRSTRDAPTAKDRAEGVLEPRARAEVWLAEQFTLGVAAGLTVAGTESWMTGVYIGVHSIDFAGQ